MIRIITVKGREFTLQPTMFPDGTSQVWKLSQDVFDSSHLEIVWNFESEREVIDLLSLRKLLPNPRYNFELHIPYLPYARQDKGVNNTQTFNLHVLADLINSLECCKVTAVDVHNPAETTRLIKNFENIPVTELHNLLIEKIKPDYIVFPDGGAMDRYNTVLNKTNILFCDKIRDQTTGTILDLQLIRGTSTNNNPIKSGAKFLIIDDLCDGGATFIRVAETLRRVAMDCEVALYVTHGIFSKGREHLLARGIDKIFTTNSILKNEDGFKV